MPGSRRRAKRHPSLTGIPGAVLALAPREWTDARRGEWCRAYLLGASGKPIGRLAPDMRAAYHRGAADGATSKAALAQHRDHATRATARRKALQEERRRHLISRIERLDALGGPILLDASKGTWPWA